MDSDILQKERPNNAINLINISCTLLRIVAQLPKTEYHFPKLNERQDEVRQHNDLSDQASEESTTQGLDVL